MSDILCWNSFNIPTELSILPTLSLETPRVEFKIKVVKFSIVPFTLDSCPNNLDSTSSSPTPEVNRNWLSLLSHPFSITVASNLLVLTTSFEK